MEETCFGNKERCGYWRCDAQVIVVRNEKRKQEKVEELHSYSLKCNKFLPITIFHWNSTCWPTVKVLNLGLCVKGQQTRHKANLKIRSYGLNIPYSFLKIPALRGWWILWYGSQHLFQKLHNNCWNKYCELDYCTEHG